MIRKVKFNYFNKFRISHQLFNILDDAQSGVGAELMAYQPSPYNNNLDLSELLQNVDDVEPVHTG